MKKYPFLLLLLLVFSSCFKSWTCKCEVKDYVKTDSLVFNGFTAVSDFTSLGNKKDLKKKCDEDKLRLETQQAKGFQINKVECTFK